jgi:hypothetical protein
MSIFLFTKSQEILTESLVGSRNVHFKQSPEEPLKLLFLLPNYTVKKLRLKNNLKICLKSQKHIFDAT